MQKIRALLFISMEEWLEFATMTLDELKETLHEFHSWNKENEQKILNGEPIDPRDMKYQDVLLMGEDFQLEQIYYVSDLTLRQILRLGIEHSVVGHKVWRINNRKLKEY